MKYCESLSRLRDTVGVDSNPVSGIDKLGLAVSFSHPFPFLAVFKVDQTHSIFSWCLGSAGSFQ